MYFTLLIIILLIILTYLFTKDILKNSTRIGCKTEYFASATYEEEALITDEEIEREKLKESCILCGGGDNLSDNPSLFNVLNRLDDYYYV